MRVQCAYHCRVDAWALAVPRAAPLAAPAGRGRAPRTARPRRCQNVALVDEITIVVVDAGEGSGAGRRRAAGSLVHVGFKPDAEPDADRHQYRG